MGLDMYLIKRKRDTYTDDDSFDEVAYWRKANQIHNWFVENIQDGNDDCGYYEVSRQKLQELLADCCDVLKYAECELQEMNGGLQKIDGEWKETTMMGRKILNKDVVSDILPTTSGFFFGSTDYDEWYLRDIENTIEQINTILDETDFTEDAILYTSSW